MLYFNISERYDDAYESYAVKYHSKCVLLLLLTRSISVIVPVTRSYSK